MTQPKISVIVPIYGVEQYLKKCLDSLLAQTLKELEIILIDDGSKDNCPKIIDEYASKDSRIITIHKANSGYGQTCNMGLNCAKGEYIAILEPDDYIKENMYEELYNLAKQNNADIVKSNFYKNYDTERYKYIQNTSWEKQHNIPSGTFKITDCPVFLSLHPSIWSCIYRREFLNKNNIRFKEAPGSGWTDNPFQVQTMCLANRIVFTNQAYYFWRIKKLDNYDELKDYTIPFLRTDEIHNWLNENSITNPDILTALYDRELRYIRIVLSMKNINDKKDCLKRIDKTIKRMNRQYIKNSKFVIRRNKKLYAYCATLPLEIVYMYMALKKYKRDIIRISFNKNEQSLTLFGKRLYYKTTEDE